MVIVCLKSSRCYSCCDECLLEMRRAVVWGRKLIEIRVVIFGTGLCYAGLSLFGTGCCFAGLSFGSCKKLYVLIAGLLSGSCKKLEVVIAWLLFVNWIVMLGVFGLWEACTPKTNALQCVEWKNIMYTRNAMSALIVLWFVFAKDLPLVIVTRWCLEVVGSDKLWESLWGSSLERRRRTSPMSKECR